MKNKLDSNNFLKFCKINQLFFYPILVVFSSLDELFDKCFISFSKFILLKFGRQLIVFHEIIKHLQWQILMLKIQFLIYTIILITLRLRTCFHYIKLKRSNYIYVLIQTFVYNKIIYYINIKSCENQSSVDKFKFVLCGCEQCTN